MEGTAPAPPPVLRTIGFVSLLVGPALGLLNLALGARTLGQLREAGIAGAPVAMIAGEIAVFLLVGGLLALGGLGLLRAARWGRWVSLVAAGATFAALLIAAVTVQIVANWPVDHAFGPIRLSPGAPALSPLWGIYLLIRLNLPDVRAWAGGRAAAVVPPGAGAVPGAPPKPETLAILSLVLSMIPFALLTQIASLILGVIALRRIARSGGTLGGRGFALAGVIISSLILAFIAAIVLMVLVFARH